MQITKPKTNIYVAKWWGFLFCGQIDVPDMHCAFFIHLFIDRDEGCLWDFHVLLLWITLQYTWECRCLFRMETSFHIHRQVGFLLRVAVTVAMFWGVSIPVFIVAVPTYTICTPLPTVHMGFLFSTPLPAFVTSSWRYLIVVLIWLSPVIWCGAYFYRPVGHWYVFFGKMSIHVLCSFQGGCFCLLLSFMSFWYFDSNPLWICGL